MSHKSESFCRPSKSAAKKKKKKKNFKQIDETSSKWEFSVCPSLLPQTLATPKAAVCGIDKLRQVECLISLIIVMMLLIDTGMFPTAAGPVETFDPCYLSLGGASVYLPPLSLRRKQTSKTTHSEAESVDISTGPYLCCSTLSICHCINCVSMLLPDTSQHIPQLSTLINVFFLPSREFLFTV